MKDPVAGQVLQHVAVDALFGCGRVVERQELLVNQPGEEPDERLDEAEVTAESLAVRDKHVVGVKDVRVEVVLEVGVSGLFHLI